MEKTGASETVLDRLDLFFSAGTHTEHIRAFMEREQDYLRSMAVVIDEGGQDEEVQPASQDEDKPRYNFNTNSKEGLDAFNLYKRYADMIEQMLTEFMEKEAADPTHEPVTLEALAEAVMDEWASPEGAVRYLCTAYIAAALDFNDFCELAMDYNDLMEKDLDDI